MHNHESSPTIPVPQFPGHRPCGVLSGCSNQALPGTARCAAHTRTAAPAPAGPCAGGCGELTHSMWGGVHLCGACLLQHGADSAELQPEVAPEQPEATWCECCGVDPSVILAGDIALCGDCDAAECGAHASCRRTDAGRWDGEEYGR